MDSSKTYIETTLSLPKDFIYGEFRELNAQIKSMWILIRKDGNSVYVCNVCGKEASVHSQMRDHIEAHHIEGICLQCNFCEKTFRSKAFLGMHKTQHTKC